MPEPPQLAPLDVEEQRVYSELLLDGRAPHPISKGVPGHPTEEAHFSRLYPGSRSCSHDPKETEWPLIKVPQGLLTPGAPPIGYHKGYSLLPSPCPQKYMWTDWANSSSTLQEGVELVQCSTAERKTTLLLLKPRFDHRPDSPLQYPGIGLTRKAEECDPPIVRTHPPVTLLIKGDHHHGMPVQGHCPRPPRNIAVACQP
ncbi:hypothetical protein AMECASPLE_036706 [Ameca splendens]|uniref:Uncharacterized protein n=1 Tax=Ameca splendens TaxID=208324 RepID=A0ABV0YWE7_9TELE